MADGLQRPHITEPGEDGGRSSSPEISEMNTFAQSVLITVAACVVLLVLVVCWFIPATVGARPGRSRLRWVRDLLSTKVSAFKAIIMRDPSFPDPDQPVHRSQSLWVGAFLPAILRAN